MTNVIAYLCECGHMQVHDVNCPLQIRLAIKERICGAHGIVSYIPEDVAREIDAAVAAALKETK